MKGLSSSGKLGFLVIIAGFSLVACDHAFTSQEQTNFASLVPDKHSAVNFQAQMTPSCAAQVAMLPPATGSVDALSYMFAPSARAIGGLMETAGPDPDAVNWPTFVEYKFNSPDIFEVYHYDSQFIYLRYEAVKTAGWIRTFDEDSLKGSGAGARWTPRYLNPGSPGFLSIYSLDKSVLSGGVYVNKPDESVNSVKNFISPSWVILDWGGCQLTRSLRLRQEWQGQGLIFEDYDYVKDQGLVHWQWHERLDHLMSRPAAKPGQYYGTYDQGTPFVIQVDTSVNPPTATRINTADGSRRSLEVVYWKSYYTGQPAWYVTTREFPELGSGIPLSPRFSVNPIVNYQIGGGLSLIHLPHLYTKAAVGAVTSPATPTPSASPKPQPTATPAPMPAANVNCSTALCNYIKKNLYAGLLGVATPDQSSLNYWLNSVSTGGNGCAQIAVYFMNQPAFVSRISTMTESSYVTLIYQSLLNRSPDLGGYTNAMTYLRNGTLSKAGLARSVLSSPEFGQRCVDTYGFPMGTGAFGGLNEF